MESWDDKRKAQHARMLLEDPMIGTFFLQAREQIYAAWTAEGDLAAREKLWQRQQALEDFRAYLHSFVATGILLTHVEQSIDGQ